MDLNEANLTEVESGMMGFWGVWDDVKLRLQNFSQSEGLSLRGLLCYTMTQLKIY